MRGNDAPWLAEDFLGGDRAARVAEWKRDQQAVKLANFQLEAMKAGLRKKGASGPEKVPDNLPSWAIKRW